MPGKKQCDDGNDHKFKMIGETGWFDEDLCREVEVDNDDKTIEGGFSDRDSEYEYDEVIEDDLLLFDEDDLTTFVYHSNYYLQNPDAVHFEGFDEKRIQKTKKLLSEKSDGRYRDLNNDQVIFEQIPTSIQTFI